MFELDITQQEDILRILERSIATSMRSTSRRQEPYFVADLVYHLPRTINRHISPIIQAAGGYLRAGGVFVHQIPTVSFSGMQSHSAVEIADLLLLAEFQDDSGHIDRTALLLQAKMTDKKGRWDPIPANRDQHRLLGIWPEFTYVNAGSLNGFQRHVRGPNSYNGGKYLYLDKTKNVATLVLYPTYPEMFYGNTFPLELLMLVQGQAGRNFVYQPSDGNNNWDQVITDLVDVTANTLTSYMSLTDGERSPRGTGYFVSGSVALGNFEYENPDDDLDPNSDIPEPPDDLIPPKSDDDNLFGVNTLYLRIKLPRTSQ